MENLTKDEFEIHSSLFGGYNKKQMDAYVQELHEMIEGLQAEVEEVRSEKEELVQKLAKAEGCYKTLWERSKGQEETSNAQEEIIHQLRAERKEREEQMNGLADLIREQKVLLKVQMQMLKNQEVMMKGQGELLKTQEGMLKNQGELSRNQEDMLKSQGEFSRNQEEILKGQGEVIRSQEALLRDHNELAKGHQDLLEGQAGLLKDQGELAAGQERILNGQDTLTDREAMERLERKVDKLGRALEKMESKGNLLPANNLDTLIRKQVKRIGKKRIN